VASAGPATLTGLVTSQNSATPAAGTAIDSQLSLLEPVSSTLTVTVPLIPAGGQSSDTLALTTATGTACPTGTFCASYSILASAGPVFSGAFSASATTLAQVSLAPSYVIDAFAFVPMSGGTLDCSPNEQKSTAVTPVAGASAAVSTLAFTACQ
jgi:hypothetical protein